MKFTAKPRYFFYPDINGNLKLPEAERLAVEIIRPKGEERGDLIYYETVQEIVADKSTAKQTVRAVSIKTKFNVATILRSHVGAVKNLETDWVDDDGKDTVMPIKSGQDLAESCAYGIARLIDLICAEVTSDVLTASEKKSSR
jgi:hypothetical protein